MKTLHRNFPLYHFELTAITALLVVLGFLAIIGVHPTWDSVRHTFRAMVNVLPVALFAGLVLHAGYHVIERRGLRAYLNQVFTLPWIILWMRLWLACWVVSFGYFWLKVSIPLINPNSWDEAFWHLDSLIHFGYFPNIFITELLKDSFLLPWLDRWYHLWLYSVVFGIAFFAASTDDLSRRRVIHSCILLWAIGAWVYLAFPAVGPIYVYEITWENLGESLPRAANAQQLLWANYQRVLAVRSGEVSQFHHTLGVAALPSLHVAFHWLFALWARRSARWLFIPFVLMTVMTLIASVLTGWHYAVDGYAGIALAWLCYRLAIRFEQGKSNTIAEDARQ